MRFNLRLLSQVRERGHSREERVKFRERGHSREERVKYWRQVHYSTEDV